MLDNPPDAPKPALGGPLLELRGAGRTIGATKAVEGLSFSLNPGEIVSLLGPSGSGKTTTLRLVAGLEPLTSGEILLGGEVVSSVRPRVFVAPEKRNLGMVFQSYALWPHMTVRKNVDYCLRAHNMDRQARAHRVAECLELVGLSALADRYPAQLSGGEQQRVAVARALSYHPRLLLMDEPLSNIDQGDRERVRGELRRLLRKQGISTLIVTHDQAEAMALSDRIIILDKGKKVEEGTPAELFERPKALFTAKFIGLSNVFAATAQRGPGGTVTVTLVDLPLSLPWRDVNPAAELPDCVHVSLRPGRLHLQREAPAEGSHALEGNVVETEYLGGAFQYHFVAQGVDLRVRSEAGSGGDASVPKGRAYLVVPDSAITVLST